MWNGLGPANRSLYLDRWLRSFSLMLQEEFTFLKNIETEWVFLLEHTTICIIAGRTKFIVSLKKLQELSSCCMCRPVVFCFCEITNLIPEELIKALHSVDVMILIDFIQAWVPVLVVVSSSVFSSSLLPHSFGSRFKSSYFIYYHRKNEYHIMSSSINQTALVQFCYILFSLHTLLKICKLAWVRLNRRTWWIANRIRWWVHRLACNPCTFYEESSHSLRLD